MNDRAALVVAIDGPGGVGKSTVSRAVANQLGLNHLDTGAFYRAATLAVLRRGVEPDDGPAVETVVASVSMDQTDDGRTSLNGEDVSQAIRSEEVTANVSAVSAIPEVRRRLVESQQLWVHRRGGAAVVEGRDIGTVVFPGAGVKIFLDADPNVRAARRSGESGSGADTVAAALARRDHLDSSRRVSPLAAAEDAVVIDTTDLTIDEVVDQIVSLVEAVSRS